MTDKDLQETKQALKNYVAWLKTASEEEIREFLVATGRYDFLNNATEKNGKENTMILATDEHEEIFADGEEKVFFLPCPFCGSTMVEDDDDDDRIQCCNCGAMGPSNGEMGETQEDLWNDRTPWAKGKFLEANSFYTRIKEDQDD